MHLLHSVCWPLAFLVFGAIVVRNATRGSSTSKASSKTSTDIAHSAANEPNLEFFEKIGLYAGGVPSAHSVRSASARAK
jgi:hypothetical protein